MAYASTRLPILLMILSVTAIYAIPTNLKAECRKGQTFITWGEIPDTAASYRVYRSSAPITSLAGLSAVGTIPFNSAYDARYNLWHVIVDSAAPLDSGTGLLVLTPKADRSTYYAVTSVRGGSENDSIVAGVNSLLTPVSERFRQWPGSVLRSYTAPYSKFWTFEYWMDYEDWPHLYNSYGDYYTITYNANIPKTMKVFPLLIFLHGYGGVDQWEFPSTGGSTSGLGMGIKDNCVPGAAINHTWWLGFSNNYGLHPLQKGDTIVDWTSMRLVRYTHAVMEDPRFVIDTNRIYLSGQSMGGGGTILIGSHYPGLFAALNPLIARVHYPEANFSERWGTYALGLPYRNGIHIYKWNNICWILDHLRGIEMAPIVDNCGSQDGLHPFFTHSWFYDVMQRNRQGLWAKWLNIGHEGAAYGTSVPGDWTRFRRNEMFPAFSNATAGNGNYGKVTQADTFNIPVKPAGYASDSAGTLNCQFDWSSSLHRLSLPGDSLIDSPDTLMITFKGLLPGLRADVTPRRLQRFTVQSNRAYRWRNISVPTSGLVDSGTVTADSIGLVTVPGFRMDTTGNRLVLFAAPGMAANRPSLRGNPVALLSSNPFHPGVRITIPVGFEKSRVDIFDVRGSLVRDLRPDGPIAAWDGKDRSGSPVAGGLYLFRISGYGQQRWTSGLLNP